MTSRLGILATIFALACAASSLAGCSFEPGERTQLAGQECYSDSQCVEGLVCVERRCRPQAPVTVADAGADGSPTDDAADVPGGGASDGGGPVIVDPADGGEQVCEPGVRRCTDGNSILECNSDGTRFEPVRNCETEAVCQGGQCVPADSDVCQYQDQPCDQEGLNNGYYCTSLDGGDGQLRCMGICQRNADDPDATCPDPGSVCTFGDGPQGVCLAGCTIGQGCDATGYGCLPYDGEPREGICVPTNTSNQVGERCDPEQIFDCEEGAVCIDLDSGGRCVAACRAFANADNAATDCATGHCVPLTDKLGMCQRDAGQSQEGDSCNQRQILRPCNQDAVTCVPSGGFQGPQCNRFCRLSEGDADCGSGQTCYQYDQQRDDLGICVNDNDF